jgi:aminoglycoside phosphotransferase (APT) family kinase protein
MSDRDLRDWLARTLGGEVTRWEQLVSGNSRTTWLADAGAPARHRAVVVRSEAGDGPFAGTELTLAREAALYAALRGSGVRVPELIDYCAERDALAMTRLEGAPDWSEAVLDDLLRELARLHALDAASLRLPGFARTSAGDVELWARIARERIAPASPLVDFAVDVLRRHHPGEPGRLVLCHGDAGPGNLLHDGRRLTGLLDWEFAHLGDPLDDLAWISVRAVLFGMELSGFGARVRAVYAPVAGVELDVARLRYWQAVVVLRNLITCLACVSNPVRGRDRTVHFMLIPALEVMLADALARVLGVDPLPEPPATEPLDGLPGLDVLGEIALSLPVLVDGLAGDPERRNRGKRMRMLTAQLAETLALAPAIAAADAAEGPPAGDEVERLGQLGRIARRRLRLFPRAAPMAAARLVAFDD